MTNQYQSQGVGVTQFNGMTPKKVIRIAGVDWHLRKDATDIAATFPHSEVQWLNVGCEPISLGNGQVHYCWILGVIVPPPGSIKAPINVLYVGFHQHKIMMSPNMLTPADQDRMHVYTCDYIDFAGSFIKQFLDITPPAAQEEQREPISPFPPQPAVVPQKGKEKGEVSEDDAE